jgi:hypothetical protein
MSIYVDGERSRQRLGFAKSLLNKLKMLGLRSKKLLYDGFLYRVDVLAPGLDKIAVTAPMGAAVVCSQPSGMKLMTADYWLTGLTPGRDVYVVDNTVSSGTEYTAISNNAVLPNAKFVPRATTSPLVVSPYTDYPDHVPTPALYSFPSEAFWVTVSASPATSALCLVEARLNFYSQAGAAEKRISAFIEGQISGVGYQVTQGVSSASLSIVSHSVGVYRFNSVSHELECAQSFIGNPSGMGAATFPGWIMFYGAPSGLQTLLLAYPTNSASAIGSFAFAVSAGDQPTLLHCVSAVNFGSYFAANPTHEPWRIFFSIYTLGAGSVTTYPVNTTLLNTLAPGVVTAGVVDWGKARAMMWQLFPWPNNNYTVAPDSAMFYSAAGNVYTWTRKYGSVEFSVSGMQGVSLVLPTLVATTPGVRPEIYHVGGGKYFCSAFKPNKLTDQADPDDHIGVVGLYYGSPFVSWETLPTPTERLLQVRVLRASSTEIVVLGVLFDAGTCYFGILRRTYSLGTWTGEWQKLAPLDVTVTDPDEAAWALGVFGEVKPNEYLAGPPALPQMPNIPYSHYATTMP